MLWKHDMLGDGDGGEMYPAANYHWVARRQHGELNC